MADLAPIAVFAYNRPEHLRRTIEALQRNSLAPHSALWIFSDHARSTEQEPAVRAVRQFVHEVQGFRSVKVIERPSNLGLFRSIVDGVTSLCDSHGMVIVVEDDLVLAPEFLEFMNAALQRFAGEQSVMHVSGYAFPAHDEHPSETFLLPITSTWGWATWARAWEKFDPDMTALARLDRCPEDRKRFNIDGAFDYYHLACQARNGNVDSWGIRWQLSVFANEGVGLFPRESLVYNAGLDGMGTHQAGHRDFHRQIGDRRVAVCDMKWPLTAQVDDMAFNQVKKFLRQYQPNRIRRVLRWLRG